MLSLSVVCHLLVIFTCVLISSGNDGEGHKDANQADAGRRLDSTDEFAKPDLDEPESEPYFSSGAADSSDNSGSGSESADQTPAPTSSFVSLVNKLRDKAKLSPYESGTSDENSTKSEAQQLYEEGMLMLERAEKHLSVRKIAFQILHESAERGHTQAREWIALGTLLGWGPYQSLPRAHSDFMQLAQEGNPRGQFGIGLMYASGLLLNASIPHALIYLTFSALGGDDLAEMAMAYRYWAGIGVEENCESALTFYYRVAQKVAKEVSDRVEAAGTTYMGPIVRRVRLLDEADANAGLFSGLFGSSDNSVETVIGGLSITEDLFQYYQFMADKKNVSAQVGLGQFYYYGRHGVEKNFAKAFHYFTVAAEAGSSLAKAFLGEMYLTGGDSLKPDPQKALSYLRQSAEEDNPVGQTGLAMAYLHGKAGLTANPLKALDLLLRAADQGWADAQLTLGRMFIGTMGMKPDYKLALKYLTMASQQGNVLAFFYLGEMHATGVGVLRSCTTAAELFKNVAERGSWSKWLMHAHAAHRAQRYDEAFVTYQLLAELGYEVAQSNVAYMLEEGKITVVDKSEFFTRAVIQWQRSAAQGSASSRIKLGDCHYYGRGTEVDYVKAVQQYRIASETYRSPQAMFNLAYMHEKGLGLKRDIHLAKRYYDMAAEASPEAKAPVFLALMKLSLSFGTEYLHECRVAKLFSEFFGSTAGAESMNSDTSSTTLDPRVTMDWDFYAIPILAGLLLVLIVYLIHERRR